MDMNVYIIILRNGKKFYLGSYEDYGRIFERYLKRYGEDLACVLREYGFNSIEDIKRLKIEERA